MPSARASRVVMASGTRRSQQAIRKSGGGIAGLKTPRRTERGSGVGQPAHRGPRHQARAEAGAACQAARTTVATLIRGSIVAGVCWIRRSPGIAWTFSGRLHPRPAAGWDGSVERSLGDRPTKLALTPRAHMQTTARCHQQRDHKSHPAREPHIDHTNSLSARIGWVAADSPASASVWFLACRGYSDRKCEHRSNSTAESHARLSAADTPRHAHAQRATSGT